MNQLAEVLAAMRAAPATSSLDDLARRLNVNRDDLDAMIGYWIHRGELALAPAAACGDGACRGCPVTRRGCAGILLTIQPAEPRHQP